MNIPIINYYHSNFKNFIGSRTCKGNSINNLKLFYLNARSLRNKFQEVESLIVDMESAVDILVITECWITTNESKFYHINSFNAYFNCRDNGYGGIAVYVNKKLTSSLLKESHAYSMVNFASLRIQSNREIFYLHVFYNPNIRFHKNLFQIIEEELATTKNNKSILLGDFNIDIVSDSAIENEHLNIIRSHGFEVHNSNATRETENSNSLIDHFATNILKHTEIHTIKSTLSDHNMIFCEIKDCLSTARNPSYITSQTDYESVKIDLINNSIINNPGNFAKLNFSILHKILSSLVEKHTKTKVNTSRKHIPVAPWANKEFLYIISQRNKLLAKYNRHRCFGG